MKKPGVRTSKDRSRSSKPGRKRGQAPGFAPPDEETHRSPNRGGENPLGDEEWGQGGEEEGKGAGNDQRRPG